MSLLGNGYRWLLNPCQITMPGGSAFATEQLFKRTDGVAKNWYLGQATVIEGVSIANTVGRPQGAMNPYAWVFPPKGGGLASLGLIEGSSEIQAPLTIAVSELSADFVSTSTLTAAVLSPVGLAAALSGNSTVTVASTGRTFLTSDVSGNSTLSTTATQLETMSADISSTGAVLDTSNVGAAVLAAIVEAGYSLKDVLRLLAAEAVGEVSGGPDNPEFTGLDGTTVRVTAAADPDGNRSGMVLVPG